MTIRNSDAWQYVEGTDQVFDVIIADLPDPKNLALSKLYTRQFYGALMERLSAQGVMVTQAGSPLFARQAFWSVAETLEAARNPYAPGEGLRVRPYHVYLPSFGDWGFVMAAPQALKPRELSLPEGLKFLNDAVWQAAQVFGADTGPVEAEVNTLQSHALAGYYQAGWDQWFE